MQRRHSAGASYLPSVTRYRQSIKPPPPPPLLGASTTGYPVLRHVCTHVSTGLIHLIFKMVFICQAPDSYARTSPSHSSPSPFSSPSSSTHSSPSSDPQPLPTFQKKLRISCHKPTVRSRVMSRKVGGQKEGDGEAKEGEREGEKVGGRR